VGGPVESIASRETERTNDPNLQHLASGWLDPAVSSQVAQAHALQQALVAAARNSDERARAVNVLRGADMYAATWPADSTQLRTLLNSSGVRALSLFTDEPQLDEAALRFGWLDADGRVPSRRIHVSEAVLFARQHDVAVLIIDLTADHALELDNGDMELMSAPPSGRPPSFPPLVSSSRQVHDGSEVKRISTRPPGAAETTSHASLSGLIPTAVDVDLEHHAVRASFAPAGVTTMIALESAPDDALTDALCAVLREYIEVEWACFVGDSDREGSHFSVALRIEPGFPKHLPEISVKLREASATSGNPCDVLVLETVDQMKRARQLGLPFYPWRKR
jgi:hypothetical protein